MHTNGSNPPPPPAHKPFVNVQTDGAQGRIDQHHFYPPRGSINDQFTLALPDDTICTMTKNNFGHTFVDAKINRHADYYNKPDAQYSGNRGVQQYVHHPVHILDNNFYIPQFYPQPQPQPPPTTMTAQNLVGYQNAVGLIVKTMAPAPVTSTVATGASTYEPPTNQLPSFQQQQQQQQQQTTLPKRSRKVLKIIDPETQKCLNENDVANSESTVPGPTSDESSNEIASKPSSGQKSETKAANTKAEKEKTAEIQRNFTAAVAAVAIEKHETVPSAAPTSTEKSLPKEPTQQLQLQPEVKPSTARRISEAEVPVAVDASSLSNMLQEKLDINKGSNVPQPTTNDSAAAPSVVIENGIVESVSEEFLNVDTDSIDSKCNGKPSDEQLAGNGVLETIESKVKHYEREMAKFLQEPGDTDIDALIYSSQFLRLMRTIVKELRHVKCPKTEAELKEVGIDKAGMPVSTVSKLPKPGSDRFLPSFIQPQSANRLGTRPTNYGGRHSDNKPRAKKLPVGRPSIDRLSRNNTENFLPRKSANAWKPSREMTATADPAEAEKLKYEKIKKEIRGLLNKITPSTYEALVEEFCSKNVCEDSTLLPMIIDLIFDKAVEEPHFCALYSDLCKRQVECEPKTSSDQITFRKGIIQKCQATFLGSNSYDEQIHACEEELKNEALENAKKEELKEKVESLKSKEKRRLNGIIRFVAELYRHNLLINSIINWCVVELITRYEKTMDDVYVEYAVNMIERVGETYEKKKALHSGSNEELAIDKIISHLSGIKSKLSNRVRFMIMNLEDLRRNNWMPRHGKQGPKTVEEVRIEAEQEILENQQEREAYERKVANREHTKRGSKSTYLGRGSTDRSEKRAQAVIASSQQLSTNIKKDTDLKKYEDQQKLGSSRHTPWSFIKPKGRGSLADNATTDRRQSSAPSPPPSNATPPPLAGDTKEHLPATVVLSKTDE